MGRRGGREKRRAKAFLLLFGEPGPCSWLYNLGVCSLQEGGEAWVPLSPHHWLLLEQQLCPLLFPSHPATVPLSTCTQI